MSRLSAPINAVVQLLKAVLGLIGHAPVRLQQAAHSSGAPETPRTVGRIVWELLPPANAPPDANTGAEPCAMVLVHNRHAPSPCADLCKARVLVLSVSDDTKQPFWTSSPPARAMAWGAKSGEAVPDSSICPI